MDRPDDILGALDDEQRQVATSLGGPVAVIAGAGTGKTRAITHRIAHGARTGDMDPRAVLAVTFTTRAAGEMRGRLHSLGVGQVQARTFHSAALRQVQYFWPRAYGTDLPQVTEGRMGLVAEAAQQQRLRVDTALLRDLLAEVSWAKVSNVTAGEYPALARAAGRQVNGVPAEQVAKIFTGQVKDWSEVGGAPGPISVYTRNTSSGTYKDWQTLAMKGRNYPSNSQKMAGNEQIAAVIALAGGIQKAAPLIASAGK